MMDNNDLDDSLKLLLDCLEEDDYRPEPKRDEEIRDMQSKFAEVYAAELASSYVVKMQPFKAKPNNTEPRVHAGNTEPGEELDIWLLTAEYHGVKVGPLQLEAMAANAEEAFEQAAKQYPHATITSAIKRSLAEPSPTLPTKRVWVMELRHRGDTTGPRHFSCSADSKGEAVEKVLQEYPMALVIDIFDRDTFFSRDSQKPAEDNELVCGAYPACADRPDHLWVVRLSDHPITGQQFAQQFYAVTGPEAALKASRYYPNAKVISISKVS
jgi:hypothetical protein